MYERTFQVSWAQLDSNAHMANTAYLDIAVDVRLSYFAEKGMPPADFVKRRIGPVVRRDEVDYFRELRMLQPFRVNLMLGGLSDDASRFRLVNEIRREDGELVARVTSLGGWLDLDARKLVVPPPALADALRSLDPFEKFEVLESSVRHL